MPRVSDLTKSKYLTRNEVEPYFRGTIKGWEEVNFARQGQSEDIGYVLTFHETDKKFRVNKTNGKRIESLTGKDDFDEWIGKQITLIWDPDVEFGGELVGGIRVYIKPEIKDDIPF